MILNREDAMNLISHREEEFIFPVELDNLTKFQLYLTGKVTKGVELFGIGLQEIRGLAFMFTFHDLIKIAIANQYRVFVIKKGSYFGKGNWHLEFLKK